MQQRRLARSGRPLQFRAIRLLADQNPIAQPECDWLSPVPGNSLESEFRSSTIQRSYPSDATAEAMIPVTMAPATTPATSHMPNQPIGTFDQATG